jgi:hypothetical protein
MSNPDNYTISKSSQRESSAPGATRLQIRKRGASNWALPVPEASFDAEGSEWAQDLALALKRAGESVTFAAKDLERLRAEASRILHPVSKNKN